MMDDNFKLGDVYVSKIENGFLLTMSGYIEKEDGKETWKDYKTFCDTIEEVKNKLEEIFNK